MGEGDWSGLELELIATHEELLLLEVKVGVEVEVEVFAASGPGSVPSCGSGVACSDCRGDSILKAASKAGRPWTTGLEHRQEDATNKQSNQTTTNGAGPIQCNQPNDGWDSVSSEAGDRLVARKWR